jgi:protein required for attachment to host cells
MIMVAPPRALGLIRPVWSQGLRSVVRDEVDKDLVKLPVREIERHLTGG